MNITTLTRIWLEPIVLTAGSLLLLLAMGCSHEKKSTEESAPKAMENTVILTTNAPQLAALTVEPAGAGHNVSVPLTGRLAWNENSTVRVFTPFAGIVRAVLVDVNQPVKRGTPLAEIQSPDFAQALAEARKAESDFRRSQQTLNRARDLFDHGAAPGKDLESAEADFASARAEMDRARGRLAIYGVTTAATNQDFLLPSPLDGVLVERNISPGQEVRPDQMLANLPQYTAPLFVVTDPARLWIQIDATEADLPNLHPGVAFTFTSRAFPEQAFTGHVEVVSESLDPNTRTIKVRGTVDNESRQLKAEMFVSVNLPGKATTGASVPTKAVYLNGDKHYVFVEAAPGHFTRQEVQVGSEEDGRVLVLAGVQRGQRVVTDGCILLQQSLKHD